jgi:class 3 adenylate cyclase
VEAARFMAGRIPGAQLVEFPGEDHLIVLGEFEPILDAIERFVIGSRPRRPSDRILVTVLTTALADERTPVAALGVGGRQEMLERHHAEICGVLARHGGREVRTPGGGAVATFAAPSRAIACARAIRRALSALGLTVRAGIHTGECDLIAGEVNGPAVDVSEAVARAAGPDEVLITGTVRDLVPGTEATLTPHPMRELPGIPGRWLLLSVDA